jgi:predicted ATPase
MCGFCSFFESDCDFILTGGKALPCGGFVLLRQLLDAGEVTIEEIKRR